jgi:hypothetical protein
LRRTGKYASLLGPPEADKDCRGLPRSGISQAQLADLDIFQQPASDYNGANVSFLSTKKITDLFTLAFIVKRRRTISSKRKALRSPRLILFVVSTGFSGP